MKIFQYGGRHRAIGTMWLTMWPVTWPTEANENTRVARGTLSAITVGSSNLCTGPKFRAAAPNIVADQNFSVVLDLFTLGAILQRYWSFNRSRLKLNYGAGRDFRVGPAFGATQKQPIIPGNLRACVPVKKIGSPGGGRVRNAGLPVIPATRY